MGPWKQRLLRWVAREGLGVAYPLFWVLPLTGSAVCGVTGALVGLLVGSPTLPLLGFGGGTGALFGSTAWLAVGLFLPFHLPGIRAATALLDDEADDERREEAERQGNEDAEEPRPRQLALFA